MSRLPPWFDRAFQFAIPAEQHPTQRVRLRGTPVRLEEMTMDVPEARLTWKPGGAWSIKEHAGHLFDLESLWATRVDEFLADTNALSPADLANTKTHEAGHNSRPLDDILQNLRAARFAWLDRLDRLDPQDFGREALHPRLRVRIRLVDHLYFVAEHDDHHLAQIWEMRGG